jgi:hypothetical protein
VPAIVTNPAPRWREPTADIPLRWGRYDERYLAGLVYIMAGLVLLAGSNTYTGVFLLLGTIAHVGGWFVLPSSGPRRLWMAWPSLICVWLLLVGPQILVVMVLPLLSWLVVRKRPARSFPVLVLPIVSGILLANTFHSSQDEPTAFAIQALVVVGSAWLARALATTKRARVLLPTAG